MPFNIGPFELMFIGLLVGVAILALIFVLFRNKLPKS